MIQIIFLLITMSSSGIQHEEWKKKTREDYETFLARNEFEKKKTVVGVGGKKWTEQWKRQYISNYFCFQVCQYHVVVNNRYHSFSKLLKPKLQNLSCGKRRTRNMTVPTLRLYLDTDTGF